MKSLDESRLFVLIEQDQLSEALDILKSLAKNTGKITEDDVISLKGRLNKLENDRNVRGIIDAAHYTTTLNQIRYGIIMLAKHFKQDNAQIVSIEIKFKEEIKQVERQELKTTFSITIILGFVAFLILYAFPTIEEFSPWINALIPTIVLFGILRNSKAKIQNQHYQVSGAAAFYILLIVMQIIWQRFIVFEGLVLNSKDIGISNCLCGYIE